MKAKIVVIISFLLAFVSCSKLQLDGIASYKLKVSDVIEETKSTFYRDDMDNIHITWEKGDLISFEMRVLDFAVLEPIEVEGSIYPFANTPDPLYCGRIEYDGAQWHTYVDGFEDEMESLDVQKSSYSRKSAVSFIFHYWIDKDLHLESTWRGEYIPLKVGRHTIAVDLPKDVLSPRKL